MTLPVTDRAACLALTFSTNPPLAHPYEPQSSLDGYSSASHGGQAKPTRFLRSPDLKPPSGIGCYGCQDLIQIDTGEKKKEIKKNVVIKNK